MAYSTFQQLLLLCLPDLHTYDSVRLKSPILEHLDIWIPLKSEWMKVFWASRAEGRAFGRAAENRLHTEIRDVNLSRSKFDARVSSNSVQRDNGWLCVVVQLFNSKQWHISTNRSALGTHVKVLAWSWCDPWERFPRTSHGWPVVQSSRTDETTPAKDNEGLQKAWCEMCLTSQS